MSLETYVEVCNCFHLWTSHVTTQTTKALWQRPTMLFKQSIMADLHCSRLTGELLSCSVRGCAVPTEKSATPGIPGSGPAGTTPRGWNKHWETNRHLSPKQRIIMNMVAMGHSFSAISLCHHPVQEYYFSLHWIFTTYNNIIFHLLLEMSKAYIPQWFTSKRWFCLDFVALPGSNGLIATRQPCHSVVHCWRSALLRPS